MFANRRLKTIFAELHFRTKAMRASAKRLFRDKPFVAQGWRCVRAPALDTKAWAALAMWQRT